MNKQAVVASAAPAHHWELELEMAAETVFDFLADGGHDPLWQPGVRSCQVLARPGGVGALYRQSVRTPAGAVSGFRYTIAHHHRPGLLGLESVSRGELQQVSLRLVPLSGARCELQVRLSPPSPEHPWRPGERWGKRLLAGLSRLPEVVGST
ncbi:MAG: hypothetical protein ACREN4_02775 [Candidatus Dormibacteria bacterium]